MVWADLSPAGNSDIFFAFSTDNGLTFSTPDNLSNNTGVSTDPQISSSGNNVYVVWEDSTPGTGDTDIFFAFSTDNGQTFSTPDNLNNETSDFSDPQISSSGNNVYVVWEGDSTLADGDDDIFFAFSTDNGQTFSPPVNLSESTEDTFDPQISSSGNNVYVVWEDFTPGNADIFFAFSTDNGQTFSIHNLSESTDFSGGQQISSSGNNVYVVWHEGPIGNFEIFFAFSTNNGQTFTDPDPLSESTQVASGPQISSSGNNVYVVWHEGPVNADNADIFFAFSTDNGQIFSTPDNLSESNVDSGASQISSSGNTVYVVWQEGNFGTTDIFYTTNNKDFGLFGSDLNLSNNAIGSVNPQISSSP